MRDSALTSSTSSLDLIAQYQAGNDAALERLWARYLPRLRRWAHGRLPRATGNITDTEDLVQDAFVRSLAHLRRMKPTATHTVFAYIRIVVLNLIRDHIRQLGRRPMNALDRAHDRIDPEPSPFEQAVGRETRERYERALESLDSDDHDLVLAAVELGLNDQEIAELFEKPSVDAARVAKARALSRLARCMETDGLVSSR